MADVVFQIKSRGGENISSAAMLAAYPNGTYRTGQTDTDGKCQLYLYRVDQEMKVLVAAEGHLPYHTNLTPGESNVVHLELEPSKDDKKALLFTRDTGCIPGIEGRLNPHKDGYVYADNIAINGRLATPAVHFQIGECLNLIDVFGVSTTIRFLVVEGQFSLIEYTVPKDYVGE